jgi:hypothetical protein
MKDVTFIKWVDSVSSLGHWIVPDELKFEERYCYSIGYVIKENDKLLYIAAHVSFNIDDKEKYDQIAGEILIPKCSIIERNVIKMVDVLHGT